MVRRLGIDEAYRIDPRFVHGVGGWWGVGRREATRHATAARRDDLSIDGEGSARARHLTDAVRAVDLARERLPQQHRQPQGRAGHRPVHAGTAKERGLVDPFDPLEAIPHSARFLAELQREFGNFGLAAAAYNGGPERVRGWLAGRRGLPAETRNYVQFITGHPVDNWKDVAGAVPAHTEPASHDLQASCIKRAPKLMQVALPGKRPQPRKPQGPPRPWGVQLATNFSQARVANVFGELKQRHGKIIGDAEPMFVTERNLSRGRRAMVALRVGTETRDEALKLCQRLRNNGGVCTVERN